MAWESIKGLWNIETQCSKNSGRSGQIQGCFEEDAIGTMIFTNVSAQKLDKKAKEDSWDTSSVSLTDADGRRQFADGLGSTIAKTLKSNTFVMDWVAYSSDSFSSGDDLDVIIVLADSKVQSRHHLYPINQLQPHNLWAYFSHRKRKASLASRWVQYMGEIIGSVLW